METRGPPRERTFFAVRVFTCVPLLFLIPLSPFLHPRLSLSPRLRILVHKLSFRRLFRLRATNSTILSRFFPTLCCLNWCNLLLLRSLSLFLSFLLFCTSLPFSIRPSSDNEKPSLRSKRETIGNTTTIIARDFAFIAIKSRSERGWILISSLCSGTLFFYLCGSIEKIALALPSSVALLTLDITNLGFSHDQTRGSSCPAFSNSFSKYRSSSSTSIKISNVRDNLFVAIIWWLW